MKKWALVGNISNFIALIPRIGYILLKYQAKSQYCTMTIYQNYRRVEQNNVGNPLITNLCGWKTIMTKKKHQGVANITPKVFASRGYVPLKISKYYSLTLGLCFQLKYLPNNTKERNILSPLTL